MTGDVTRDSVRGAERNHESVPMASKLFVTWLQGETRNIDQLSGQVALRNYTRVATEGRERAVSSAECGQPLDPGDDERVEGRLV